MSKWLKNAVFYEIYPQSFQDSNSDGIGDFNGIIQRLDYIKDLGCTAIWLNPCFDSPFNDAGYDVRNYKMAAPRYGTNEDLRNLFQEVHKRNMHIILDLVPGHTSIEHPWFQESMKAESNPHSNRYIWTNHIWEGTEGIPSIAGCIRGISDRNGSCAVNFFSSQPALNYGFAKPEKPWQQELNCQDAMATRNAMKDVMRFWLQMGCDGFRVDMAGSLIKNDPGQKETIQLWQDFRSFLDNEFPNAVLISEWGEPEKALMGGFHMDFLLHFGPSHYLDLFRAEHPYFSEDGKGDISHFVEYYLSNYNKTKDKGLICIPSGNHDMTRIAHKLSPDQLKLAFAFLLSMPGVPFIYYGDEIGMRYQEELPSKEGGYDRTGSRTPMQWSHTDVNAGFSTATPDQLYLPIDPDYNRPNVEQQAKDQDSLLNEIKKLLQIRQNHVALQSEAEINFIYANPNSYPFIYKRSIEGESILVILNPSKDKVTIELNETYSGQLIYCFNKESIFEGSKITIPGVSASFYLLK